MGLEFIPIFKEWADEYDETVAGHDPEYADVFLGYEEMLKMITEKSGQTVLEFGSGTGNLTLALLNAGKDVYPVEPSVEMRALAQSKPELATVEFLAGDMENFPLPNRNIDTIAANFVFHHLNGIEKKRALKKYAALLPQGGKVIIGDTMFVSQLRFDAIITAAIAAGKQTLASDLQREYYPLLPDLENYFHEAGFAVKFWQINTFAWIAEAVKK
ncbi:putative methyltransferase YrrT [Enterococcus saigonensis]|uniref:Uncharacterized methyltransferase EsVE80_20190 n=1 Tax=Enterococcus saigonensis TaxID=1805431 RepID=A0A679IMI5_9ENTE|nr:class I SAM-dependent methyltransferase [Enterococcus saigonensis]BCA86496.1 putative methyltransferase YrrT [Enterococcus saigonensis]